MKIKLTCFILALLGSWTFVFGQGSSLTEMELENFQIRTDQEAYLAGDRVWFVAKLFKNHESYRYSKLVYLALIDPDGNSIHEEKMLLTDQDLAFGDLFLPPTSSTGIFSLVMYTKWMANYQDFPIATKKIVVVNPNQQNSVGEPALFVEQTPFENASVSIFHTSSQSELIEVQDIDGKTLEVMEGVRPLEKVLLKTKSNQPLRLVFRNQTIVQQPSPFFWNPVDFSLKPSTLNSSAEGKVVVHSNWDILEEKQLSPTGVELDKSIYQGLKAFQISVLSDQNQVIWSYQVEMPVANQSQLKIDPKGQVGREMEVSVSGIPVGLTSGVVVAKESEPNQILDFGQVLNHPNWNQAGKTKTSANLIQALANPAESSLILKDYSPMFDYRPWQVNISQRFSSSTGTQDFSFQLPDTWLKEMVSKSIYREHFEISEEVIQLQSPFVADKVYYLEDYDEFGDLESLIKEIIPQIKLKNSKSTDRKEIFVANTDNLQVKFDKVPLVLVDFYKPISQEEFWKIDPNTLDRIELYYHRNTVEKTNLGEEVGDGMIVFYTKNNEYALKNNLPKDRYFLKDVNVPRSPRYANQETSLVSGNSLQFLNAEMRVSRGRGSMDNLLFDTAGKWKIEAWLVGNSGFELLQREVLIDP